MNPDQWDLQWASEMKIWCGEMTNFSKDCGSYFMEDTTPKGSIRTASRVFKWVGNPTGFLQYHDLEGMLDCAQKMVYKSLYNKLKDNVNTLEDYYAVENHSALMHYGGQMRGTSLYRCDFSGMSRSVVQNILLLLSQKKFDVSPKVDVVPIPNSTPMRSPMSLYRSRVIRKLEMLEKTQATYLLKKHDPMMYYHEDSVLQYFKETAQNRLSDAISIMSNLNVTNVIIPGDGFGFFSQVAKYLHKNVVSGESSRMMVGVAAELGTELTCENGISTINRGFEKYGTDCVVFVSFLWAVAPDVIDYGRSLGLRMLNYDKFLYYRGSSDHVEYGSRALRGSKELPWHGLPIKLSEEKNYHTDKPLLTEIMKGPLYFDSLKGLRQLVLYSEMYPFKIQISKESKILASDLQEASKLHSFLLVDKKPCVWLVRCPHNAGKGLAYDIDTWKIIPSPVDINPHIIGSVSSVHLKKIFSRMIVSHGSGKSSKHRKGTKNTTTVPREYSGEMVSLQNVKFIRNTKYYMKSMVTLTPPVRTIFDDGIVQLVWLKSGTYYYEEDYGAKKYVGFTLSS